MRRALLSIPIFVLGLGCGGSRGEEPTEPSSLSQSIVLPTYSQAIPSRIAVGGQHTLELGPNGTVWSWGDNEHGQLGLGNHLSRTYPTRIATLPYIYAVAAGESHSLAIEVFAHAILE